MKKNQSGKPKRKKILVILAVLFVLGIIGSIMPSEDKGKEDVQSVKTENLEKEDSKKEEPSENTSETTKEETAELQTEQVQQLGNTEEQQDLNEEETRSIPESNKELIVYVTKSGDKYHVQGCRYLKSIGGEMTEQEAINAGYQPCSVCCP